MLGNRFVALGDSDKIHARSGPNTRIIGAKDATLVRRFAECLLQDRDVALGNKVAMGSDGLANGVLREKSALLVVLDLRTSGRCEMLEISGQSDQRYRCSGCPARELVPWNLGHAQELSDGS